ARFDSLFGGAARKPEECLTQRHMDLACSIQAVTEEVVLRLTRALAAETRLKSLCLAGGVALNCVANGKVLRDCSFDDTWIQPAAGGAGGRNWCRACGLSRRTQTTPPHRQSHRRHERLLSRPGLRRPGLRAAARWDRCALPSP